MEFVVVIAACCVWALHLRKKVKRNRRTIVVQQKVTSGPKTATRSQSNFQPLPKPFEAKSAQPVPSHPVVCGPAYVIDGDSIVVKKTQIRLFGVDAPEMNHPYGKKAKWALVALCKGQQVHAEIVEQDAHGRTVAKCHLPDGRDLSAEMVKLGLAIDWAKFSGGIYRALEVSDARKKMWLADARQKGHMHVWDKFEATRKRNSNS